MDSTLNGPNSEGSSTWNDPEYTGLTEKLLAAKKARHVALARLPFEEKVRIIVELQKIAFGPLHIVPHLSVCPVIAQRQAAIH